MTTFKIGDRVRCVNSGDSSDTGGLIENGETYYVEDIKFLYNETYLHLNGVSGGWFETRFEKVESEAPGIDKFIYDKAKELAEAVDNGTMAGYYSALGFLVTIFQELSDYTQE